MSLGKTKAGSRTLSVRLPNAHADRLAAAATAKNVSKSALITEALYGRVRPSYPGLAALAQILSIAKLARKSQSLDASTVKDLAAQIDILRQIASAEVFE